MYRICAYCINFFYHHQVRLLSDRIISTSKYAITLWKKMKFFKNKLRRNYWTNEIGDTFSKIMENNHRTTNRGKGMYHSCSCLLFFNLIFCENILLHAGLTFTRIISRDSFPVFEKLFQLPGFFDVRYIRYWVAPVSHFHVFRYTLDLCPRILRKCLEKRTHNTPLGLGLTSDDGEDGKLNSG